MRRPWSCARGDGDYGTRVAVYSAAAVGGKHDKDILAGLRCFRSEGWEDEDNCGSLSRSNPRVRVAGERELTVGGREQLRLTAHKAGVRGAKPRYHARKGSPTEAIGPSECPRECLLYATPGILSAMTPMFVCWNNTLPTQHLTASRLRGGSARQTTSPSGQGYVYPVETRVVRRCHILGAPTLI